MKLFKKVNKVLASFGNNKAIERLHADAPTEKKINIENGDKIAESKEGEFWIGIQELNGYLFLETIVISGINIKTFNGGTLIFSDDTNEFILKSDTQEIVSEFSNEFNRFVTKISFDITEAEIQRVVKREFNQVRFEFKKKTLIFSKVP